MENAAEPLSNPPPKRTNWTAVVICIVAAVLLLVAAVAGGIVYFVRFRGDKEAKKTEEAKQVDTPSAVLKKVIAATKELDYDTLDKLSHGAVKDKYKGHAENINAAKAAVGKGNEKAQKWLDDEKASLKNLKIDIKAEEIDGDLAVVYGVCSGNPAGPKFNGPSAEFFMKVDGEWKWISEEDYVKEALAQYPAPRDLKPSDLFRKIAEAFRTLNFYPVVNLCHGKLKEKAMKLTWDVIKVKAGAYAGNEKAKKTLSDLKNILKSIKMEIKGEKFIDDNYAVVFGTEFGSEDGKTERVFQYFEKIGGEWKMINDEEYFNFKIGGLTVSKGASPTQVVRRAFEAYRDLDFHIAVDLSDGDAKKKIKNALTLKVFVECEDEEAKQEFEKLKAEIGEMTLTLKDERINGDSAEVICVLTTPSERIGKVILKKVDGEWKITGFGDRTKRNVAEEARKLFQDGKVYYNRGDYLKARACFVQAQNLGSREADAFIKKCDDKIKEMPLPDKPASEPRGGRRRRR